MIAAFIAAVGAWAWVWTSFVRALPMWMIYAADIAFFGFLAFMFVREWRLASRDHPSGYTAVRHVTEVEYLPPLPRSDGQRRVVE